MIKKTWWYGFDPVTFEYAGMRSSYEKPDNATDVAFSGISSPIWNPDKNIWEGDSIEEELKNLRSQPDDSTTETPMANLVQQVATYKETTDTSISNLMLQVAQLQSTLADIASSQPENNTPDSK